MREAVGANDQLAGSVEARRFTGGYAVRRVRAVAARCAAERTARRAAKGAPRCAAKGAPRRATNFIYSCTRHRNDGT